jgi:low temperature requirement protein LtrA
MCTTRKHRPHRLTLPLALNALLFLCVAGIFAGFFGGLYSTNSDTSAILIAIYVVLMVEFFGTLAISMTWRKLSFTATHIGERLGLLGLIIIGEGVIGTLKTVVRTMGKNGPTFDASAQIFSIILILVCLILYCFVQPQLTVHTIGVHVVRTGTQFVDASCANWFAGFYTSTKYPSIVSVPSNNKCGWHYTCLSTSRYLV